MKTLKQVWLGGYTMYRLIKIKELKGYRFFQDFKWDECNCALFNQNNIIYGWNGSGKTTLCDFFKELEEGQFSTTESSFSLLFEDTVSRANSTITKNKVGSIPYAFKVFHQNYIQENIAKADPVKHIFAVGKGQKEKIDEVKELRREEKEQTARLKVFENDLTGKKEAFEQLKTDKAKVIKDAAKYTNAYNKNKFFSAIHALTSRQLLSDDEYQKALSVIRAEPRASIPCINTKFIQSTVKEYIRSILKETPVNITIEALKKDAQVGSWVEQGISIHSDRHSKTCLFCGNQISDNRFEELRAHFNDSYKKLSDKIDGSVSLLYEKKQQFNSAKVSLPNTGLFYPELQSLYAPLQEKALGVCDEYILAIDGIIEILKKKKSDMINSAYADDFAEILGSLTFDYAVFENIQELIKVHNERTEHFNDSIKRAQAQVELHHLSEFTDEIAEAERVISDKEKEIREQTACHAKLLQSISQLEQEIKNSQIPADAINRDISFIMGRSELVFRNTEMGYLITRNGKKAKNLSKGEENAIALIYFFNTLLDVNVDVEQTIIVLDDPISSFDSNFYYNAISYIKEKTEQAGQTFIFTHKFSLLKDYSLMYKRDTNRYTIQRIQNVPQIINEEALIGQYHDEYAYLFKKVYSFVKNPPADTSDYLQYPNMARRLLEAFLTFKLPLPNDKYTMIDKVLELEKGGNTAAGRAVLRLLNNRSHLRAISDSEIADDIDSITILPDTLQHLLNFMKQHDKKHYDTLAKLCDPDYQEDGEAVEIIRPIFRKVRLYEMAASAGVGSFLDDDIPSEEYSVSNAECTYAIKISGDSMEPVIHDGSIALIKQCEEIPHTHIGIVWYNGNCYCKKIVQSNDKLLLVSANKDYQPMEVTSYDEYHVFGEVVDIIPPN